MNTATRHLLPVALLFPWILSCQHLPAARTQPLPETAAPSAPAITPGVPCFPELAAATPAEAAATPMGQALLAWAAEAANENSIPETTYTLYRQFKRNGERSGFQRPYYRKRELLAQEAMQAWLTGDYARMDRINDLIWAICEESTWVLPAHEGGPDHIDLFAAETGTTLAHLLLLLGDRLPKEIGGRVRREVKTRIMDPYLRNAQHYGWNSGRNNWTGVCAGSVGECFLLLETDPERLNAALSLVQTQLARYIEKGFAPDGVSLEGIGYWNFGLSHYVTFAEMLRAASGGAMDLLEGAKVRAIARSPLALYLGANHFASFSDGHEDSVMMSFLCARLGERAAAPELATLPGDTGDWVIGNVLRNLLWPAAPVAAPANRATVFLPESGLVRYVGRLAQSATLVLAAKAGSNDEPHNHNDIGSFILCVEGETFLCDPGAGLYNRDYFSPKRYENIFANSYGHSVPRIGGMLQEKGPEHRGSIEMPSPQAIRIAFAEAYAVPELNEIVRTFHMAEGAVRLEDNFDFANEGHAVEEAFMTWLPVETDGPVARIIGAKGVVELRAGESTFSTERLEDACRANRKQGVLTRITASYPAAPRLTARFSIAYHPRPGVNAP